MRARTAIATLTLVAGAATAQTVYDNGEFGPNIASIGGEFGSDIYAQGMIVPADVVLQEYGMWLFGGDGGAPLISFEIWGDNAGNPDPNNVLHVGAQHQGVLPDLTRIDTTGANLVLTEGQIVHIVMNGNVDQQSQGTYGSTWDGDQGSTFPGGSMNWSNDNGNSWSGGIGEGDWGAYALFTAIPAPGSVGLLALGGLVAARRRR